MKAVVLTCDKYMPFADHTIQTYEKLWRNNYFTYRVPYNDNYPQSIKKKYGDKIEFIKTESPIKATVLTLLQDLDDNEWIYWCMDDRYLARIRDREAQEIYNLVKTIEDPQICSFLVIATKPYFHTDKFLKKDSKLLTNSGLVLYETVFSNGRVMKSAWRPQFVRVKVIRRMFESFPDYNFKAAEMNDFPKEKLEGEKFYVPEKNLVIVGESTHRGELTENCASSFKKMGLEIPANFTVTKKYMLQGYLPYKVAGLEFTLPVKMQKFITSVNRWYWRQK
ncbi:MAG: hypothetical protein F6K25_22735 [Okeania sp. SIO2G4]|uniref:hypothetical protein n=1 Tax=unclassified Okeania TaxID=2634635 RepID=UPI0013B99B03|nr:MULTISPECIES: hypothetical protein [unclassified Okeania]NEP41535.1 hypothetical protein [Okeania sp. SIO2H7]NEP74513.1 hypothetical protein [Okeania sp. SIO2G5]NEP95587.1 hypothetical protein [Okeania sp. SIO2F5]NEQ93328.1 hypothetical protein [Okeania sp. SIO2G4]